jgi:hypothetical protein
MHRVLQALYPTEPAALPTDVTLHDALVGSRFVWSLTELSVQFFQKRREIDVHKSRAQREDGPRRYLNPTLRRLNVGGCNATPRPRLVAHEAVDEILHPKAP